MLSVNLLGLVSHSFCHNLSALPLLQECSHRQHRNRRAWQCSSKNVFTKRGEGLCHPCFAKPCFGGMVSPEIIQPNVWCMSWFRVSAWVVRGEESEREVGGGAVEGKGSEFTSINGCFDLVTWNFTLEPHSVARVALL